MKMSFYGWKRKELGSRSKWLGYHKQRGKAPEKIKSFKRFDNNVKGGYRKLVKNYTKKLYHDYLTELYFHFYLDWED